MKRSPTGFVAICQCSKFVGAMDFTRTPKAEASKFLGRWLQDGCTVMPHFTGSWEATVEACQCDGADQPKAEYQGRRCMCIGSGCRAGPGCPHYTKDCQKHINHQTAMAAAQEGGAK